jgi:hypothetical protein
MDGYAVDDLGEDFLTDTSTKVRIAGIGKAAGSLW